MPLSAFLNSIPLAWHLAGGVLLFLNDNEEIYYWTKLGEEYIHAYSTLTSELVDRNFYFAK